MADDLQGYVQEHDASRVQEHYAFSSSPDEGQAAKLLRLARELRELLSNPSIPEQVKKSLRDQPWSAKLLSSLEGS